MSNESLSIIKEVCFTSAAQLQREWHIPTSLAKLIRHQPGYQAGAEMAITQVHSGGWRLYRRVGSNWYDASLQDMEF